MSNFYLDVIKDRLYTQKADSTARRSAQTAMYRILDSLVRLLTPILAFTCEEIWSYMPHSAKDNAEFVLLNDVPVPDVANRDDALEAKWETLLAVRGDVSKALENARNEKVIGHSLTAAVTLFADGELYELLKKEEENLVTYLIVSAVSVKPLAEAPQDAAAGDAGISVSVSAATGEKCERCWMFSESVGSNSEHPTLCSRCAENLA